MSDQAKSAIQKVVPSFTPVSSGSLQRKCG